MQQQHTHRKQSARTSKQSSKRLSTKSTTTTTTSQQQHRNRHQVEGKTRSSILGIAQSKSIQNVYKIYLFTRRIICEAFLSQNFCTELCFGVPLCVCVYRRFSGFFLFLKENRFLA